MFDAALQHELKLSAAQTFAVLAHDAVYVPGAQRGDNETLSAQLMRVYAPSVEVAVLDAAFAIITTRRDHVPRPRRFDRGANLDLMRLGASPTASSVIRGRCSASSDRCSLSMMTSKPGASSMTSAHSFSRR